MDEEQLPEPSMGEIGRIVLRTERDLTELRRDLAETYVRQDVWQMSEKAAGIRVGEVTSDLNDLRLSVERLVSLREADRRLLWTAILGPILTGLVVGLILLAVKAHF